jgi:hypothetical protein
VAEIASTGAWCAGVLPVPGQWGNYVVVFLEDQTADMTGKDFLTRTNTLLLQTRTPAAFKVGTRYRISVSEEKGGEVGQLRERRPDGERLFQERP